MKPREVTLDVLSSIRPPRSPRQGTGYRWRGISHVEVLRILTQSLQDQGIVLGNPFCNLSRDGLDVEIVSPIKNVSGGLPERFLGITNSNTGHKTLSLFSGVIQEYPIPVVQIPYTLRHLKKVNHKRVLKKMSELFLDCDYVLESLIHTMKSEQISDIEEERLLMTAGRHKLIPWSRIGLVDAIFQSLEEAKKTNWSLLSAFAKISRMNPITTRLEQVTLFRGILPTKAKLPKSLSERFT